MACGLLVLAVLSWGLPAVTAQEEEASKKGEKKLAQRVAALEKLLKHFSGEKNEIFITGANLHIVNGLGQTDCFDEEEGDFIPDCPNGLGNLIVGYNELRSRAPFCDPEVISCEDLRTGSPNVVVGEQHNFSRFWGFVVGLMNELSGDFAAVSGGMQNTASGFGAVASGGGGNTARGEFAASVSGGQVNTASSTLATVSGGRNITQETKFGWSAGSEADEVMVGNLRSP
jgi:hypothetical protein